MKVVFVSGPRCERCGHELSASEFTAGDKTLDTWWPIPCTEELVRTELIHPTIEPWNGCGGRLVLEEPTRGVMPMALAGMTTPNCAEEA